MIKENKNFIIKMCFSFALLLCLNTCFILGVSAYTSSEIVDSQKALEINSAIAGKQEQSTIVKATERKNSSESAYSSSLDASENLIVNGNFESNDNSTWKAYFDDTKGTPVFTWDDQTYYGKTGHSLSITGNNVSGSVVGKVSIKPGNTYNFSAFTKGLNATTSGAISIYIAQYNKNEKLIQGTDTFFIKDGTFDWEKVGGNFVSDPNASSVMINLMLDGSGTAWFDEISLINTGVIPGPDAKVVANTGIKKTTYKGFRVNLDGSKSFAKNGSSLTFNWSIESQPVGSNSTLSDADTANPYFIPDIAGDYNLSLTVKDNYGNSDTKKVTIRAKQFSDTSDDDSFNSINKLTQKLLTGYTFTDFIPLTDGWIIVGDTSKNQIIILNTLTGEVAKTYQLKARPEKIDFDFDKGIIVATQSTTDNIAKIDVYSDEVSYITTTPNTGNGVNSGISEIRDITIGKNGIVFSLRNKLVGSLVGILDISQNTEIGYTHVNDGQLISFNQVNNEIIIGDRGSTPSVLHRYKYDDKDHSLSFLQITGDLGGNGIDLAISNDGKHIAFCCGGGNGGAGRYYTIFDIDSSDISKNFGEWDTGAYPTSAVFSYDNKYLLATNGSGVKLFSVDNHTLIKTVGPSISDICKVGISRGGRIGYAYAYTGNWELYTFRIDDPSLPLNIESISTDKENPQAESTNISVTANTSGGTNDKFYHFIVYDGNHWMSQQAYSTSNTFNWKPEAPGEYYLVVEAKDAESVNDYDVYNTIRYNITKKPTSITISGPSNCTITTGAGITLEYSASVEDNEGNILPVQNVSWSIEGQVAGVLIDASTGVVTVDSTAQPGTFVIIAKVGDVSDTITVTIAIVSSIEISGAEKIEIPLIGAATSKYTVVVKDQNGKLMLEELVDWVVHDSEHKPVSGLNMSNTGLITVNSTAVPNTYIIEARSSTNPSVYNTKTILLTTTSAISAPRLTGFTWEQGSTLGTTKATVVTAGLLKYIVGTANMLVQPNIGDPATAYTNILTANTDIPVTAGQHIFIVSIDNDGKVIGWADVTVDTENIKAGPAMGDLNDDGAVNALDFAVMKQYLLGKTININKMNSDMNMDGEINAFDFALLREQLLK